MKTEILPRPEEENAIARAERLIGAILIDAGRLSLQDAERILRLQREEKIRFGDAGVRLGILAPQDVQNALARQFQYPYLSPGAVTLSPEIVAAHAPFSSEVEALRGLRTHLLLRWFREDASGNALAIVSSSPKDGRSLIAANLAVVFAQAGKRTLLVDADLRRSRQHELFNIESRAGLSAVLSGRGGIDVIQGVAGFRDLSLLPAGVRPPNPSELLAGAHFPALMQELQQRYEVVLVDTPASGSFSDAESISAATGAAIAIIRKNVSRLDETRRLCDMVAQTRANFLGSVLNEY